MSSMYIKHLHFFYIVGFSFFVQIILSGQLNWYHITRNEQIKRELSFLMLFLLTMAAFLIQAADTEMKDALFLPPTRNHRGSWAGLEYTAQIPASPFQHH